MQCKEIRFLGQSCGLFSPEQGYSLDGAASKYFAVIYFFSSKCKCHGPREISPELSVGQGGEAVLHKGLGCALLSPDPRPQCCRTLRGWAGETQGCDSAGGCQEPRAEIESAAQSERQQCRQGAGLQRAGLGENFSRLAPCLPLVLAQVKGRARLRCWRCAGQLRRTQRGLSLPHHVLGEGRVLHGAADEARRGRSQLQAAPHHLHDSGVSTPPCLSSPRSVPIKAALWGLGECL